MVGGLIVSQALTLFTTPVVYVYLDRLSNMFTQWGRSTNPDHDAHLDAHSSVKQAAE
jgi:HAE1 family hydrophobic/amphiphilic exporter-1